MTAVPHKTVKHQNRGPLRLKIQNKSSPYQNLKFRLEIEGTLQAGFEEAIIPTPESANTKTEVTNAKSSNSKMTFGQNKCYTLTLKRGIAFSMDLFYWRKQVVE